jgi:hypothetical protein
MIYKNNAYLYLRDKWGFLEGDLIKIGVTSKLKERYQSESMEQYPTWYLRVYVYPEELLKIIDDLIRPYFVKYRKIHAKGKELYSRRVIDEFEAFVKYIEVKLQCSLQMITADDIDIMVKPRGLPPQKYMDKYIEPHTRITRKLSSNSYIECLPPRKYICIESPYMTPALHGPFLSHHFLKQFPKFDPTPQPNYHVPIAAVIAPSLTPYENIRQMKIKLNTLLFGPNSQYVVYTEPSIGITKFITDLIHTDRRYNKKQKCLKHSITIDVPNSPYMIRFSYDFKSKRFTTRKDAKSIF